MRKKKIICAIISLFMCTNIINAQTITLNSNISQQTESLASNLSVAQKITEKFDTSVTNTIDERPVTHPNKVSRAQAALILFPTSATSTSNYEYAYLNSDAGSEYIKTPVGKWDVELKLDDNFSPYDYKIGQGYDLSNCNGTLRLKYGAVYYFQHGGFNNYTVDISNKNNLRIETDRNTGKQYTATSLYIRYKFDILYDSYTGFDPAKLNPLHGNTNWTKGPYILYDIDTNFTGAFDSGITVAQVKSNPTKYLTDVKPNIPYNDAQIDRGNDANINSGTGNAIFQKYEEYRKYITNTASSTEYSYVYGYEKETDTDYSVNSHYQPNGNVSVSTKYVDDGNGGRIVNGYTINASVEGLTTSKTYPNTTSIYKKNDSNSSAYLNEPAENQGDLWHNINSAEIRIHKPGEEATEDNIIYKKSIPINNNIGNITLDLDVLNLPEALKAYKNLDMSKITLKVNYNENIRMMTNKTVLTDDYKQSTSDVNYKDYNTIINYVNSLSSTEYTNKTTANVDKYHNDHTDIIRTFKTIITPRTAVLAQDTFEVGPSPKSASTSLSPNDPEPLVMSVTVNPPNATTKLEGGKFAVIVNVKGMKTTALTTYLKDTVAPNMITYNNKLSPDNKPESNEWSYTSKMPDNPVTGYTDWHTDFEVTNLKIVAENGSIIFDSSRSEDKSKMPADATKTSFTVSNITANPDQVGKATVTATYTYNYNQRYLSKINNSTQIDVNGNPLSISRTYQTKVEGLCGQAQATMSIYSLTGETIK